MITSESTKSPPATLPSDTLSGDRPIPVASKPARPFARLLAMMAVLAAALSLLSLLGRYGWLLDLLSFGRQHLAMGALLLAAVAVLARQRWAASLAFAAAILQAWFLIPSPQAVMLADGALLRVVSLNLLEENRAAGEVLGLLRRSGADIVALQEVDAFWLKQTASLRDIYPYTTAPDGRLRTTNLLLSRHELVDSELLVAPGDPAINAALRVVIEIGGTQVAVYNLHPTTPRSPLQWRSRNHDLAWFARTIAARDTDRPRVVLGDLNTPPWSPYFADLLEGAGLRDSAGGGLRWPTRQPPLLEPHLALLGAPVDDVLVSEGIATTGFSVGPHVGSDHLPVVADLRLARAQPLAQPSGLSLAPIPHEDEVTAVAFSPDGKLLATASAGGTARLVAVADGCELARVTHDKGITAMVFSPDGKLLATASYDDTVRLVAVADGRELARISHDFPTAVAFSPDGKLLATASLTKAQIVAVADGRELARVTHNSTVWAVAFSPDGKLLATASADGTARLVAVADGRELARVSHHKGVTAVAFSPDGKLLATASADDTARLVAVADGRELTHVTHGDIVNAVAFSPDGKLLATASDDNTVRLVAVADGRELARVTHGDIVNAVAFSPDGKLLATASADDTVRLVAVADGRELARVTHGDIVNAVAFSPDGKLLATASADGRVHVLSTDLENMSRQLCTGQGCNLLHAEWRSLYLGDLLRQPTCANWTTLRSTPRGLDQDDTGPLGQRHPHTHDPRALLISHKYT